MYIYKNLCNQDITGQDVERCRFYLESSGWDLELALGSFYENDGMEVEDLDAARPQPAGAEAPKEPPKPTGTSSTGAAPTGASSKPMSNVNTFASRFGSSKKDDDEEDIESDSDEEGQAFYAGGSETSGQQIIGPPKKKEGADFVKHMFKKAREHGAEAVDPGTAGGPGPSRSVFSGSGFKLGSNGKLHIIEKNKPL